MNIAIASSNTQIPQCCKEILSDEQIQDLREVKELLSKSSKHLFTIIKPHKTGSQASTFIAYDSNKEKHLLKLLKGTESRPIGARPTSVFLKLKMKL